MWARCNIWKERELGGENGAEDMGDALGRVKGGLSNVPGLVSGVGSWPIILP